MSWFWRTVWSCASGFSAYPPLARASRQELWRYLLLLTLISSAVLSVVVMREFRARMQELVAFVQQLPTIAITDGAATLEAPQPVRLERRDVAGIGDLLIVADTTGQTQTLEHPAGFGVFLTAHDVTIRQGARLRRYSLQSIPRLTIDDAFIADWGRRLTRWCYGVAPLVMFVSGLGARLMQALFWSAIAWAVRRVTGRPLAFPVVWRVAVFALGPPVLFATLVETLVMGHTHPLLWFMYMTIYLVLFNGALAVTAHALEDKTAVGSRQ